MHVYRKESVELSNELSLINQRGADMSRLGGIRPSRGYLYLFKVDGSTHLFVYPDDPVIVGLTGYDESKKIIVDLAVDRKAFERLVAKGLTVYNTLLGGLKTSTLKEPDFVTFIKFVDQSPV